MALEIITRPCSRRLQRMPVTCPWCSRKLHIEKRQTTPCRCGALHRWTGETIYHIPRVHR